MFQRRDDEFNTNESQLIDRYLKDLEKKERTQRIRQERPRYRRRLRFVLPLLLVAVSVLAVLVGLCSMGVLPMPKIDASFFYSPFDSDDSSDSAPTKHSSGSEMPTVEIISSDSVVTLPNQNSAANRPTEIYGTFLNLSDDFNPTDTKKTNALLDEVERNGFTTLFVKLNDASGFYLDSAAIESALEQTIATAHQKSLSVCGVVDLTPLIEGCFTNPAQTASVQTKLLAAASLEGLDGLFIQSVRRTPEETDFCTYMATGTPYGYLNYNRDLLTQTVTALSQEVRQKNGAMLFGLMCDSIYATADVKEGGIKTKASHQMWRDDAADVLSWMQQGLFDVVFVTADTTTNSKTLPFETLVNWWDKNTPATCSLGFVLSSDRATAGKGEWRNPDQLTRQLMTLKDIDRNLFCFNSYKALAEDSSGGAAVVYKYLKGDVEDNYVLRDLSFTSPTKRDFTTYENSVAIIGASDPNFDLLLNSVAVKRTEYGYFSLQLDLKVGKNTFTFTHKGKTETFVVYYRYTVLKNASPTSSLSLNGGDNLIVKATARTGSTVKATLNGKTVTLQQTETEEYSDFSTFSGSFEMPSAKTKEQKLGRITFIGQHNGVTERLTGGAITVKKKVVVSSSSSTVSPPPSGGGYIGVGNTLIAEVTKQQAETFNGEKAADDLSLPTNNYLPKGTLDYCKENTDYDPSSGNSYRLMRYGKRVYTSNVRTLRGTLPSKNSISTKSLVTDGSHTVLTLKTDWKAPFKVQILPQKYSGGSGKNRTTITSRTFTYVDITFCYADKLNVDANKLAESPIFSKVQILKGTTDYTLRLYLQKVGEFFGWAADYDAAGNLVFRFVNPVKATKADNKYGGRLDNIKIVVDAGHGGSDAGALGANKNYNEEQLNLLLAKKVAAKLESIGATVVLTRTSDTGMTNEARMNKVRNARPNLALSIHRDSATNTTANGFTTFYFNPYTHQAAEKINNQMKKAKIYRTIRTMQGHVFFLSRVADCPVVLTENGFMSNSQDYNNIMLKDSANEKCADALVKGIVDYFLTIG